MQWALVLLISIPLCFIRFGQSSIDPIKAPSKCDPPCYHGGQCKNGSCVCTPGWSGRQCESCFGRVNLESLSGMITDGPWNYSKNLRCSWLIDSRKDAEEQKEPSRISLRLSSFVTECGWDHMYIFDGDGMFGKQLAALSGIMSPISESSNKEFIAESGAAFLYFHSDLAYNMSGFNISYEINKCPNDCSGNGHCIFDSSSPPKCQCEGNWTGPACDRPSCAESCAVHTGQCIEDQCICVQNYHGPDCATSTEEGVWEELAIEEPEPGGRASHGAVLIGDEMWIAGGTGFRGENLTLLQKFNLTNKTWTDVPPTDGEMEPAPRYDHSLVQYQGNLYMFGGIIGEKNITSEFWKYDVSTSSWLIKPNDDHGSGTVVPYPSVGHTAHVVGDRMIVIFGFNPLRGYMNTIQEYHFNSSKWVIPKTQSCSIEGSYGHSSVYDPISKKIYIFGGFHGRDQPAGSLIDRLYGYDPVSRVWDRLSPSGYQLFRHAAGMNGPLMVVVGGNAHNETTTGRRTQCYADMLLAYDTRCDRWYDLKATVAVSPGTARFGHTIIEYNDNLFVYGGFNGRMLSNILKFKQGECNVARDKTTCNSLEGGRKCVWDRDLCVEWNSTLPENCPPPAPTPDLNPTNCEVHTTCKSCLKYNSLSCYWCNGVCSPNCPKSDNPLLRVDECFQSEKCCGFHQTCFACSEDEKCKWQDAHSGKCIEKEDGELSEPKKEGKKEKVAEDSETNMIGKAGKAEPVSICDPPCSHYNSCQLCTNKSCMWCSTFNRCVEVNAYRAAFAYGQCTEWTSRLSDCAQPRNCSAAQTCKSCQDMGPSCGWCDDGSNTGLGKCLEGGKDGPVAWDEDQYEYFQNSTICSATGSGSWHFFDCPACQCNGHGYCNKTDSKDNICEVCEGETEGKHCDRCKKGYFGNALNGGNCTLCQCNGKATDCNPSTGACYCTTKGVSGKHCDKCDQKYVGNPKNQTCFYELSVDFIFTFKLDDSDSKDKYVNQINFVTRPSKKGTDVTFKLTCTGSHAMVNLTVESGAFDGNRKFFSKIPCSEIERRFSDKEFHFGTEANTTFFVYLYDFSTPVIIQISFAQTPPIDWIRFFITFACCFISLLFVAAVFWKVKLSVDLYRRRQRMYVEMANMASRPFGSVQLELSGPGTLNKVHPSPVSVEPCADYRAAIVTVAVRLPTGGKRYSPNGQSGLAVASALCYLTPAQTALLQMPPSPSQQERKAKRRRPTCLS